MNVDGDDVMNKKHISSMHNNSYENKLSIYMLGLFAMICRIRSEGGMGRVGEGV